MRKKSKRANYEKVGHKSTSFNSAAARRRLKIKRKLSKAPRKRNRAQ